jgi:RNA polymerase sigma-70 factor (ECF subfamily)
VRSEADDHKKSLVVSPPGGHEDDYACGEYDVSDDDLLTAAQRGDQQAFVQLCRRHSSLVNNKIIRIVRNQQDAEDAFQDTLMRAYTHLTSFRRSSKFSTWLTAIGINSALMIMRKRRVRREIHANMGCHEIRKEELHDPVDVSPGPEAIYLTQQSALLVRRAIEKLHPSLRSVVKHYYGSECSLDKTAEAHGISLAATKSRLSRGRGRLRSSLARYGVFKARS